MTVRCRLALLVIAGLVLTGCGSVHSGNAAVVGDERISMSEADEVTEGYCTLAAQNAAAQGASSIPGAEVRRQALSLLILESVAEQVAERDDISITVAGLDREDLAQARQIFGDQTDLVVSTIKRNERALAVATELARRQLGAEADDMSEQELGQVGQEILRAEADAMDLSIDPRFGMTGIGEPASPSGSLSVAGPVLEGQQLPEALSCSA